jgi:hypothetical protein
VRVQQNPLLLPLASSLGRGCARRRCALCLARVMEPASARPRPRTMGRRTHLPAIDSVAHTADAGFTPFAVRAGGWESRWHGIAHTSRTIWRTSFAPPAARPRQRALRRSLRPGRRGAGPSGRRRPATLNSRKRRSSLEALADAVTVMQVAALAPDGWSARGAVDREALQIRATWPARARPLGEPLELRRGEELVGPGVANR